MTTPETAKGTTKTPPAEAKKVEATQPAKEPETVKVADTASQAAKITDEGPSRDVLVQATDVGYYGGKVRSPGDEFTYHQPKGEKELPSWMEKASDKKKSEGKEDHPQETSSVVMRDGLASFDEDGNPRDPVDLSGVHAFKGTPNRK